MNRLVLVSLMLFAAAAPAAERWIGTADGSSIEVRLDDRGSATITRFAPAPMGFDVLAGRSEAPFRVMERSAREMKAVATIRGADVRLTLLRAADESASMDALIGTFRIDGRDMATTWREYGDLRLIDLAAGTSRTLVPLADGSLVVAGSLERIVLPRSTNAFAQRRVSFASGTTHLAGTLIVPKGTIRAGVVIVHGSGPIYRTAMFHRAAMFARLGMATLVYDKRGTGQSEGDVTGADVLTLASDAAAAAAHLRSLLHVPVGFQGHSEAGSVIPHATLTGGAAFAIIVSGGPVSQFAIEEYQKRNALEAAGFSEETIGTALAFLRDVLEFVAHGGDRSPLDERYRAAAREPWFTKLGLPREPPPPGVVTPSMTKTRINLTTEFPRTAFASIPLLVLLGAEDRVVPPHDSERAWSEVLREAAHPMSAIVVIPRADHGLKVPAYETIQRQWLADLLRSN
jgi:alpha-beta hydrolase superfamily lysophospholipase